MARFLFKLQSLLDLKIQLEDNLKNELGKAIHRYELEKQALRRLSMEREKCIEEFRSLSGGSVRADKLRQHNAYISVMKDKIAAQKENVNQAGLIVDNYRERLLKAVQERKVLEKLKEKRYQAFLKEQEKLEQRHVDELTSYKHTERTGSDE